MTQVHVHVHGRVSLLARLSSCGCWITALPRGPPMPTRLLVRSRSHMLGVRPCCCWLRWRLWPGVGCRDGAGCDIMMLMLILRPIHRRELSKYELSLAPYSSGSIGTTCSKGLCQRPFRSVLCRACVWWSSIEPNPGHRRAFSAWIGYVPCTGLLQIQPWPPQPSDGTVIFAKDETYRWVAERVCVHCKFQDTSVKQRAHLLSQIPRVLC